MHTPGTTDVLGLPVAWRHRPGGGPTVVLLHGGLADGRTFDPLVAHLPADWDVWTIDRRGHGRTPDTAEPFGYENMVHETVEVLTTTVGGPVHLVGHSDGANLALHVAVQHPDLVRSVSAFSANLDPSGYQDGSVTVNEMVAAVGPTYSEVSPDGAAHFPAVVEKVFVLWATEPTLTPADVARITCPVLVAAGTDDVILETHTRTIADAVPDATLAIIPETSHMSIDEAPATCAALVVETVMRSSGGGATHRPMT